MIQVVMSKSKKSNNSGTSNAPLTKGEFREFEKKLDKRFDKMDNRADKMDERASKMDERASKMDERADKVDERLAKIDERFDKSDAKIDKLADMMMKMFRQLEMRIRDGVESIKVYKVL